MEDKMKNIVVLKNLPSNLVEEAIVILKCNKKKTEFIKKQIKNDSSKSHISKVDKPKDYIVKEAEMVISNYISNIESQKLSKHKKDNKKLEKRYKNLKIATIIMAVVLVISLL